MSKIIRIISLIFGQKSTISLRMVPQLSPISQRLGDIMVLVNDDWKQMVTQKQQVYCSYLLRLWREGHSSQSPWRASLESAQTGKIYRFAGLEELFVFLRQQEVSNNKQDKGEQLTDLKD